MEYIENAPEIATSQHPVLTALNEKIADLEAKVAKGLELDAERIQTANRLRNEKFQFEERVKNVLVEAMEDYDQETIKHIAEQLDITLAVSKQIEVNVTFTIDLEYEFGEEPNADWDFDFSVSHSDIVDYQADVVYSRDV